MPKERADTEMAWPVNQPMTKDEVNLCVERCDTDKDACTDSDEVIDNQVSSYLLAKVNWISRHILGAYM